MGFLKRILLLALLSAPQIGFADDRLVQIFVPTSLIETGLMRHLLPRFSLKTQVRVEMISDPAKADLVFGNNGRTVFEGAGQVWKIDRRSPDNKSAIKFYDWLTSDIGQRTVVSFAPDGAALFGLPGAKSEARTTVEFDGDAAVGHDVALKKCTRCHAVDDKTHWSSIGSTPSFGVLRSLTDWEERFSMFYVLKPHATFTQIAEVTQPFPDNLPPPIAPIELTFDEVEAVVAYVAMMPAADLGKPLEHQ